MNNREIIICTNAPNSAALKKISTRLLNHRLIACANIIGPIESQFFWENAVEHSVEYMLMAKTLKRLEKKVVKIIEEMHPYDCPVVETINIGSMNTSATLWMKEALKPRKIRKHV